MSLLPYDERWADKNYPTAKHVPFLTSEQFLTCALQAYWAACHAIKPPENEFWLQRVDDGPRAGQYLAWAGPETFYNELLRELQERVRLQAIKRGDLIRQYYSPAELKQLQKEQAEFDSLAEALIARSEAQP